MPKSKEIHQQHLAPFTIKELENAIPAHCFERSLLNSAAYVVVDYSIIIAMLCVGYYFDSYISKNVSWIVTILFWNCMWLLQGSVMTGLFVIGHECGHQAFSPSKKANDAFGWFIHSLLLVPYHSWRITHGMHHKNNAHLEKDQVYLPKTYSQVQKPGQSFISEVPETPLGNFIQLLVSGTIGFPIYLANNSWGQNYKGKAASHYLPSSPMFKPDQKFDVIVSDIGVFIVLTALTLFGYNTSVLSVMKFYFVPWLWFNFFLFSFTYLQHTDKRVPRYRGEEWNFIKGALSTVDLDYGVLNYAFHHLPNTHVAHHLFSRIPHYHAREATECLKKVLGDYYLEDNKTPILKALWNRWTTCHYVDDEGDVVYYKTVDFSKRN